MDIKRDLENNLAFICFGRFGVRIMVVDDAAAAKARMASLC